MPAACWNSTAARWNGLPTPACAISILPGSLLAWSISSTTELTLSLLGLVTSTLRKRAVSVHRREILSRVEWELLIEAWIGGIGRDISEQHGVAVRRRFGDEVGAQIGRRARLVLDHERLADEFGHFLSDQPREKISSAAGGVRDDQMDRLGWIVLRGGTLDRTHCADRDNRSQQRRSK